MNNQFKSAMADVGIITDADIVADGSIQRFHIDGDKRDSKNGWAVLHNDGVLAGAFGSWRTGEQHTWCERSNEQLTPAEREARRRAIESAKAIRKAEEKKRRDAAAVEAQRAWESSKPETGEHKYLRDKNVKPYGVRTNGHQLLVPLRDITGYLHSIQSISPDGRKTFLKDGAIKGHYHGIGKPKDRILIVEGYATGATVHEATGQAVAVAFNGGNLEFVARAIRSKYPELPITIAGDNDASAGNPGRTKAEVAATAVSGHLVIPEFGDDRPVGVSDFNDLARLSGHEAVTEQITSATVIEPKQTGVVMRRASEIAIEPIHWVWPGYLAQNMLHVIAGPPGCGKTTITLSFVATVTSAGRWPDGTRAQRGSVAIWSGEDGGADTIIPRLVAMGADRDRVHLIEATRTEDGTRPFDPATDLDLLRHQLSTVPDVRLLIIDPIVSAVPGDSHKNAEVRRGLQPLVDLARAQKLAVIGITHYSKGTRGGNPIERVTGSIAFGALARVVFGTGKATEDEAPNVLARVKSNIGSDSGGFEYQIEYDEIQPGVVGSRIEWGQSLEGSARDILATCESEDTGSELDDATWWLKSELSDGPIAAKELQRLAKESGHSWATVRRAKAELGVESEKSAFKGEWRWHLPREDAHTPNLEHLGLKKPLKPALDKGFYEGAQDTDSIEHLGEDSAQGAQAEPNVSTLDGTRIDTGENASPGAEGAQPAVCEHLGSEERF